MVATKHDRRTMCMQGKLSPSRQIVLLGQTAYMSTTSMKILHLYLGMALDSFKCYWTHTVQRSDV